MAATISNEYDVIIVGAGPAGSSCAMFLGREGNKVLLIDKAKFPRDKTCGDACSGKSVSVLRELGLLDEIETSAHGKIFGVIFSSPNGTVLEVPGKEAKASGFVCRREVLDNIIFKGAKKYVNTLEEFTVTDLLREGNQVVGVTGIDKSGKQQQFRAKIVAGADGAASVVAQKVGMFELDGAHHCTAVRGYYDGVTGMKEMIEIHFTKTVLPGYLWIFPYEDGTANVGVGMLTKDIKKYKINLKELMEKEIHENPIFKERFANAKPITDVKGWNLPLGSKIRKHIAGDGWVLLGDAASLIDPFSGEGMGNAMTSAKIAFRTISRSLRLGSYSEKILHEYEEELKRELKDEMAMSYNLQRLGKHQFMLNFVIGKAVKNAEMRDMISTMVVNEEAKKGFVSPLFYLKLLFT
ncbi:Digeranylgeranylglycerophospholipid reductase [uncultured archaeon]|nr:Digeranylgeranylglycerophospholipid reductase [uncultured archaeon]